MEENDTVTGGEGLTIEQAAAAYSKAMAPQEVPKDHSEGGEQDESETTDDELQASEEDAGDETDGETDEQEHTAEGEDDESDSEQGRFVADNGRVRLADGTITTIHELKRGFLRESDYTRKTQETAALHTETAAERERIKATEQQLTEQREYVSNLFRSIMPQAPDIALMKTDPMGYMAQKADHEQWVQHLDYLDQQAQLSAQERQAKQQSETTEKAKTEWAALVKATPELKDQAKAAKYFGDIEAYAKTEGYTVEELQAAISSDHRQAITLRKAALWDKLQASKAGLPGKIENRPPVQRGGRRLNPGENRARAVTDAIVTAKTTGRLDDVAAAYHASRK